MLLAGKDVDVEFQVIRGRAPSVSFNGARVTVQVNRPREGYPLLYSWVKRKAGLAIRQSVWKNSRLLGLEVKRISIKDQRGRWGSCSATGGLNFSFRLGMAPSEVMEYVVIHELTHLKVRNHSKEFWGRVASACPGYKEKQAWLERNSPNLGIPRPR